MVAEGRLGYDDVFVGEFEAPVRAATGGRGVDLVLDPVGGDTFRAGLAALATFGRLVSFGNASSAEPWQVGRPELYPGARSVSGFSILTLAQTDPAAFRALAERAFTKAADGTVALPVTAEFELAEVAEAHRLMGARASTGKLLPGWLPGDRAGRGIPNTLNTPNTLGTWSTR